MTGKLSCRVPSRWDETSFLSFVIQSKAKDLFLGCRKDSSLALGMSDLLDMTGAGKEREEGS